MILQRYLLQSFSVWWIFLPFLGITLYGASKSMEGRGRMFEFLFGWMVVPLILIVVFSVSNIDIGAIMQGITSQSEVSGVFKGAYAILLALSPLELQLYSCPCVKEKDRMGGNLAACLDFIYHCICVSVHRGNPWLWLDGKRHDGIVQCNGSGFFSWRGGGAA